MIHANIAQLIYCPNLFNLRINVTDFPAINGPLLPLHLTFQQLMRAYMHRLWVHISSFSFNPLLCQLMSIQHPNA